jgi:hypothetical protein
MGKHRWLAIVGGLFWMMFTAVCGTVLFERKKKKYKCGDTRKGSRNACEVQ